MDKEQIPRTRLFDNAHQLSLVRVCGEAYLLNPAFDRHRHPVQGQPLFLPILLFQQIEEHSAR